MRSEVFLGELTAGLHDLVSSFYIKQMTFDTIVQRMSREEHV